MAIALSGLVKAALAWRAGEKEMIGGWVYLYFYSEFVFVLFIYICRISSGWVVAELATLYFYNSLHFHVLCPNSVGGWTMMLAKSGIWRVRSVFNELLAGPTHFVR